MLPNIMYTVHETIFDNVIANVIANWQTRVGVKNTRRGVPGERPQ